MITDSVFYTPSANLIRQRRDTFTTYQLQKPSESFFTDRKSNSTANVAFLEEKYAKQQQCQECIRRHHIINYQRRHIAQLYDENKKITEQLRSSIMANDKYEQDIERLNYHLRKMNTHLYQYQINLDHLKQKNTPDKKTSPKIGREPEVITNDDESVLTNDHLKRLRYEVEMYNRIVAAKQHKEEKNLRKALDFWF